MKAEEELQFMMDFYPEIFPTRKHCLNHLFCCVGNGYQWYKGELVDRESEFEKRYRLAEPIVKAKPRNEEIYLARLSVENEMKANMGNHYRVTPANAKYNFEWHKPSEEYSCLYNYPKNIKEDWFALLKECEDMLIEEGIIHSMNIGENTKEAQENGYGMSFNP